MSTINSLDPRVTRLQIDLEHQPDVTKTDLDQDETYEVFHQGKSGAHHVHVGSVHAPSKELAMILAKEQYGRRGQTLNLWVVNTADILAMRAEDSDVFETTPEKKYRDVAAYMVRNKVEAFKQAQKEGATE